MADSRVNVTFDPEISQHLIELTKATKQSVQKLAGITFLNYCVIITALLAP
ncbi:hypothetical protein [Wolbachia endosymbiont (group A) of Longitarsus flavicornis]|uniref:hypothetical protein n=1 Tax=Wolbachia endosymbiont (group A) of Longitarsus flavicornis TaxID=3066134 RepID=UPI0030CA1897